jgi:hypothetical protein
MREYSEKISLTQNSRGIYSLDTSIGCASGMENEAGGCYNDCYAAKSAKLYGYDFSKTVLRSFENERQRIQIVKKIGRIGLDFVRIGTSGDPSENWQHTISIIKQIEHCNKQIVIITRHWTELTDEQLQYFSTINICINTSISALDKPELLDSCLNQYERLKPYCKSILRVVSASFNLDNPGGHRMAKIQAALFKNDAVIDTVLRVNKSNLLVKSGVINVTKSEFLGKKALISKYNKSTYFGKCSTCHEMCGLNVKSELQHPEKPGTVKQLGIFKSKRK